MEKPDIEKKLEALERIAPQIPGMIGVIAVDFSMERFRAQNWIGTTTSSWPKRKAKTKWGVTPRNKGRALLIDSGRMRRSIHVAQSNMERTVIQSNDPKAVAHNEGFRGLVNQNVSSHRRTRRNGRKRTTYTVKAHTRKIRQNIPQRRFLGNSPYLLKRLEREVTAMMIKAIK